jgi:hypothetical protein
VHGLDRRKFLGQTAGAALFGGSVPALLAACGGGDGEGVATVGEAAEQARAVVGDVVDFALASDEWEGDFGFVTLRLHAGVVDGNDVFFVRTDASDAEIAEREGLVHVPKLAPLASGRLSGDAFVFDGAAQPAVLSSEPGRDDYTPAWRLHRVRWKSEPRRLGSVAEVEEAQQENAVSVERTGAVVNFAVVKWSTGELPVDAERKQYLGPGQLLERPDTTAMRVKFKLNQCYPGSRYIVTDHSIEPAAAMTSTVFAPALQDGPSSAGATGRTNVLLNGTPGPGPMGFQPSAFDTDAGDPEWSPYWDHFSYRWKEDAEPRVLTSQTAVHEARDDGELDEFPGTPDTNGQVFTVNCPVPVLAPPTFRA